MRTTSQGTIDQDAIGEITRDVTPDMERDMVRAAQLLEDAHELVRQAVPLARPAYDALEARKEARFLAGLDVNDPTNAALMERFGELRVFDAAWGMVQTLGPFAR